MTTTSKNILIVEDDRMLCTIFEMFTKELGHNITSMVRTGAEAIKSCTENRPDLVLMDIHIEGKLDGIETSRLILEQFNIPVIYITSEIYETAIQNAIMSNTYGFMIKPIYKKNLGVAIEFAYSKHKIDNAKN